jgi:hypothetical protein
METKKVFIHPIYSKKQELIDYFKNKIIFDYDLVEKHNTLQYYKECIWKLENDYL